MARRWSVLFRTTKYCWKRLNGPTRLHATAAEMHEGGWTRCARSSVVSAANSDGRPMPEPGNRAGWRAGGCSNGRGLPRKRRRCVRAHSARRARLSRPARGPGVCPSRIGTARRSGRPWPTFTPRRVINGTRPRRRQWAGRRRRRRAAGRLLERRGVLAGRCRQQLADPGLETTGRLLVKTLDAALPVDQEVGGKVPLGGEEAC